MKAVVLTQFILLQAAIKSVLDVPSYIINKQGESKGYIVCQRALSNEEFDKLVAAGDVVDGAVYTWRKLSGANYRFVFFVITEMLMFLLPIEDEEKPLQIDYIKQSIVRMGDGSSNTRGGKSGRGRGGGRGGRRGRSGGGRDSNRDRDRNSKKMDVKPVEEDSGTVKEGGMEVDPLAGAKRKRDNEPDGPEKSDRGAGPSVIKKVKVE
jgi:lupus La protein